MPKQITVKQGDCIASIAVEHGFCPDALWNDPANRDLKQKRSSPHLLVAGDTVVVPDLKPRRASCPAGQRHSFRRKGVPERLRLVLQDAEGEPRRQANYTLKIDGSLRTGQSDPDGRIDEPIPANARYGELRIGDGADAEVIPLVLGGMDPIDELSGVQMRLQNLGFACGPVDGQFGTELQEALRGFQGKYGLAVTGEPDQATRDKLVELHES